MWSRLWLAMAIGAVAFFLFIVSRPYRGSGDDPSPFAKTDIANLGTVLDAFEVDSGRYPTNAEGLGALVAAPAALCALEWAGIQGSSL